MASASRRTSRSNGIATTSWEAITTYAAPRRNSTRPSASLRRRFARFLRTAFPTPRPATIPTCAGPESPEALITTNPSSPERLPTRYTAANREEASATNGRPLRSEPSPTLEPAFPYHGATRASSHAGAIPVLSLTTPDIGLIRTLHNEVGPRSRGWRLWTPKVYPRCLGTRPQPPPRENSALVAKQRTVAFRPIPWPARETQPSRDSPDTLYCKVFGPCARSGERPLPVDLALLPPGLDVQYTPAALSVRRSFPRGG